MKNETKMRITNTLIELPHKVYLPRILLYPLNNYLLKIRKNNLNIFIEELTFHNVKDFTLLQHLTGVEFLEKITQERLNNFNNFKNNLKVIHGGDNIYLLQEAFSGFKYYHSKDVAEKLLKNFFVKEYSSYSSLLLSLEKECLFHLLLLKNAHHNEAEYINGFYNSFHGPFINRFFKEFDDIDLIKAMGNYYFEKVYEGDSYGKNEFLTSCDKTSRRIIKLARRYEQTDKNTPFDWFVELEEYF